MFSTLFPFIILSLHFHFLIIYALVLQWMQCIYIQVTAKGRNSDRVYTLKYEDGEVETIDLATERFRFLGGAKRSASNGNGSAANDQSKRRRINDDEDSDEEFEFDDEVSYDDDTGNAGEASKANRRPSMSDGSEFLASENDGEMDDDDSEEEFEFDEEEDLEDSEDEEALMVTGELYQTHVGGGLRPLGSSEPY